jgi:general secretion pathway protein C
MHEKNLHSRTASNQRAADLEQALDRAIQFFARVPLQSWKFLVIFLLVLWISHSLARLIWLIIPAPEIPAAAVALTTPSASGAEAQTVDINQLKSLQIFGSAQQTSSEQPTATPAVETEATVDTQLNLILMGVIASSDENAGRAIIAANGQQDVYAPGAELPVGKGVTLAKVLDLRIILNNNGRFESLWLYQEGAAGGRSQTNYATPDQAASRSWSEESEPATADGNQPPVFVDRNQQAQGDVGPVENDLPADVSRSIADVVAMSIHREGGQVIGYRIRPGRNAEQFTALGLQANDIVTAVNGVPLNNPGKIMEIYKNMSSATSANLEIKRGGSVLSVDVVLQ